MRYFEKKKNTITIEQYYAVKYFGIACCLSTKLCLTNGLYIECNETKSILIISICLNKLKTK